MSQIPNTKSPFSIPATIESNQEVKLEYARQGNVKQKTTGKRPPKGAVVGAKSVIQTKNEPVVGRNIFRGA